MKIQVNLSEFQDAIKKIQKLTPKKHTLKILVNMLINANDNNITVGTTDLEAILKIKVRGSVSEPGLLLLSPDTLKIISKIKKGNCLLITDKEIKVDNKVIKFSHIDAENYPSLDTYQCNELGFATTEKELSNLLVVKYAASRDYHRPVFNAVCVNKENFVATDTHRLSVKEITFENNLERPVIIPIGTIELLDSMLNKKSDNKIECHVSSGGFEKVGDKRESRYDYIKFTFDNVELTSRLIEGQYVNWKQVIPQQYKTKITIDKELIMEELAFVKDLVYKDSKIVRFTALDNKLHISAKNKDNSIELDIPAKIEKDEWEQQIGFNYDYFVEAIKNNVGKEINFTITGALSPAMINNDLVLPVRLTA